MFWRRKRKGVKEFTKADVDVLRELYGQRIHELIVENNDLRRELKSSAQLIKALENVAFTREIERRALH